MHIYLFSFFKKLNRNQKLRIVLFQLITIITSFLELISLSIIIPLVLSIIGSNSITIELFNININISQSDKYFIITLFLIFFLLSSIFNLFSMYYIKVTSNKIGAEIGNNIYYFFLNQKYLFYIKKKSSEVAKTIIQEIGRIPGTIITPSLNIIGKGFSSLSIIIFLLIFNLKITAIILFVLFFFYLIIINLTSKILRRNDDVYSKTSSKRFNIIQESLNSIREIILTRNQNFFSSNFNSTNNEFHEKLAKNQVIAEFPRFLLESLFVISIVIFFSISTFNGNFESFTNSLANLSLYCIAFFKLLPNFQNIYSSLSTIKGNYNSIKFINNELNKLKPSKHLKKNERNNQKIEGFFNKIIFENLTFEYKSKFKIYIKKFNFDLAKNKKTLILGKTGSGKSTILDLTVGLIKPQEGKITYYSDNKIIRTNTIFNNISYISQKSTLYNDSLINNITNYQEIKFNKKYLEKIFEFTKLNQIRNGKNFIISENGSNISGGQRQKISIARALYRMPKILILDEATNSLDKNYEKYFFNNFSKFFPNINLISVMHNFDKISFFDQIILIENGKIQYCGNYENIKNNQLFKNLNN